MRDYLENAKANLIDSKQSGQHSVQGLPSFDLSSKTQGALKLPGLEAEPTGELQLELRNELIVPDSQNLSIVTDEPIMSVEEVPIMPVEEVPIMSVEELPIVSVEEVPIMLSLIHI